MMIFHDVRKDGFAVSGRNMVVTYIENSDSFKYQWINQHLSQFHFSSLIKKWQFKTEASIRILSLRIRNLINGGASVVQFQCQTLPTCIKEFCTVVLILGYTLETMGKGSIESSINVHHNGKILVLSRISFQHPVRQPMSLSLELES